MTNGYGPVGSVLNEQPPSDYLATHASELVTSSSRRTAVAVDRPPRVPTPASNRPASGMHPAYEVVYDDANGSPMLAFDAGQWFDVTGASPRPVSVRHALKRDPAWSGAVVQTICLWMRKNPNHERSFDLATELALAVGELARQAH